MSLDLKKGQLNIVGKPLKTTSIGKLGPQGAEFILNGGKVPQRKEKLPPGSPPIKVVNRIKKAIQQGRRY